MSPTEALTWVQRISAASILLQTIELGQVRAVAADDGVWRWDIMRRDADVFPRPIRWLLDHTLAYPNFLVLLALRGIAALALFFWPHAVPIAFLFLSTVLIALRWRGSFNGGSDFMTLVVLSALTAASAFPDHPRVTEGSLWYIAIQVCNSYFLAGFSKLRTPNWRSGRALSGFLACTIYGSPPIPLSLAQHPIFSRAASWFVIGWQCLFPLALLHPVACLALIACATGFHLTNVYVFGLNRFLWAWASA